MIEIQSFCLPYFFQDKVSVFLLDGNKITVPIFHFQDATSKGGIKMYSPKIREDLITKIYQKARAKGVRMTTLVNGILENALNGGDELEETIANGQKFGFSKKDGEQSGEAGS